MRVRLTDHARERAAQMGVRTRRVKDTLMMADIVYENGPTSKYPGTWVAQLADLAVPFFETTDPDGEPVRVAVTVLWRGTEEWVREENRMVTA